MFEIQNPAADPTDDKENEEVPTPGATPAPSPNSPPPTPLPTKETSAMNRTPFLLTVFSILLIGAFLLPAPAMAQGTTIIGPITVPANSTVTLPNTSALSRPDMIHSAQLTVVRTSGSVSVALPTTMVVRFGLNLQASTATKPVTGAFTFHNFVGRNGPTGSTNQANTYSSSAPSALTTRWFFPITMPRATWSLPQFSNPTTHPSTAILILQH